MRLRRAVPSAELQHRMSQWLRGALPVGDCSTFAALLPRAGGGRRAGGGGARAGSPARENNLCCDTSAFHEGADAATHEARPV